MTSKEKVIELSKKGITSKAISEQLKISVRTVQRYLQSAGEGKK
jgi:DNA-binding NarL/FixJ family response regulator